MQTNTSLIAALAAVLRAGSQGQVCHLKMADKTQFSNLTLVSHLKTGSAGYEESSRPKLNRPIETRRISAQPRAVLEGPARGP